MVNKQKNQKWNVRPLKTGRPPGSNSYGDKTEAIRLPLCVLSNLEPFLEEYKRERKTIMDNGYLKDIESAKLEQLGDCWNWILKAT